MTRDAEGPLEVAEGGGPPVGTPWTLDIVGKYQETADLEHAAPLPRVGEGIELIRAGGSRRYLRVRDVIHVLQPSATGRPTVREGASGPNAIMTDETGTLPTRLLRAGLPRVVAEVVEPNAAGSESYGTDPEPA